MELLASTQECSLEAVSASKAVISSLIFAIKALSLYPNDHAHCQTAMTRLHNDLKDFLNQCQELIIHVKKNRLLFGNAVVHEGSGKEGDPAFALFRDGVLSLVFMRGIQSWETKALVNMLAKYKSLPVEPEGDIVTALWDAQLPSIKYEAVDHVSQAEPKGGIPLAEKSSYSAPELTPVKELNTFATGEVQAYAGSSSETDYEIQYLLEIDPTSLRLTTEETRKLQEMVRDQEERNATQDVLDTMADILKSQQGEEFLDAVLEYMEEELQEALGRKDFDLAFQILRRLHQVRQLSKGSCSWSLSRISNFFLKVSLSDFFDPFKDILHVMSASEIEKARKVLLLLPSDAVSALAPMILEAPSSSIEKMLSDVIVSLASRSVKSLEKLLDTAGEDLALRMVPLLARMDVESVERILVKLVHHPSERIRLESLGIIAARKLWVPEKIISLIDDESVHIRQLFIKYLSCRRGETPERILLDYLQDRNFRGRDGNHILACFKALGRCGTARCIPFLEDILLKGGWISKFHTSTRRRGAAHALMELQIEKAKQVLDKASRCRYPGVRGAAKSIIKKRGGS